jgi:site-specific DNA-methyltransferase (adenine-specific)
MTLEIDRIYCGDCLDFMREMPDKGVDLVLTDPPYGIGITDKRTVGGGNKAFGRPGTWVSAKDYGVSDWDSVRIDERALAEMCRVSKNQIIFGGNYYADLLDPSSCWLVWDKDNGENNFADCELAWTSFKTAVRKFKWRWHGMLQEDMRHKEERIHPTQKPVPLFMQILEKYSKPGDLVLDPFLGSGTTAIACLRTGRHFIGIEKHEPYFIMAQERIDKERAQVRLFDVLGGVTA